MTGEMGTIVLWLSLGAIALAADFIYDRVAKSKKRR
jgi:hypothetical protein